VQDSPSINSRRYIRPTFIKLTLYYKDSNSGYLYDYYRLDSSCCVTVVFSKGPSIFPELRLCVELEEKDRTPAACYVYSKRHRPFLHASGVLCVLKGYAVSVPWN